MTVKVGFLGGGVTTLAFLKFLEKIPDMEVLIVTDELLEAPALRYAAERQIRVSTNHLDALKHPDIEVLIELAEGRADLRALIQEHLPKKVTMLMGDQARFLFHILSSLIEVEFSSIEERFMHNIKDIKKSIADFATITKNIDILAINASIEAARAGEAGKGFAVVASSIKDLVKNSRDTLQQVRTALEKLTGIHKDMQDTRSGLKPKTDESRNY